MMASMVLLSFLLLGTSFAGLSYQYTLKEKRDTLESNADYVASFTSQALLRGMTTSDTVFQSYISTIAMTSDSGIIIATEDGQIAFAADSEDGADNHTSLVGDTLPQSAVDAALKGSFTGMSNLGGLYGEKRYVVGIPITLTLPDTELVQGLVFVTSGTSNLTAMWRGMTTIFLLSAVAVIFVACIISSVTSMKQSQPIKEIAEAARAFGHGDFKVRVNTEHAGRGDEIGELAEAFNSMAESLERSEERRTEFIANVSHELKTPMTTIAGFADGILDGTIPPEREGEYLQVISSETRRLSRLVRNMLDLSRLQSEEGNTAQEQFDIGETMLRVLVSLETKVNARKLEVATDLPEEPLMVWGDPDAITQVCYNLLDNAIKFSREGGTLGISISTKGTKAYITVSNEGETISPEEVPLVFDRFHKTDRSRSADRDGVGLGLYIVKTILNAHKENITCESSEGVTKFTFTLTRA